MQPARANAEARKRVAILQSNYVPWRGYFDLIASVDEFIFYDDVQYTNRDWRNRNRIKTPQGSQWLTIPVGGDRHRNICDVAVADPACGLKHWRTLSVNYARAPCFDEIASWLQPLYAEPWTSLSALNQRLLASICGFLGIDAKLSQSCDYRAEGGRNERLLALCGEAGAGVYVSGPNAADYLDVDAFGRAGIAVEWVDYAGYRDYPQLWGEFDPRLSILDLLFNCGSDSASYMKLESS